MSGLIFSLQLQEVHLWRKEKAVFYKRTFWKNMDFSHSFGKRNYPTSVDQNKVPTGEVEVADPRDPKVPPIGLGGPWVKDECFDEV